MGLERFLDDTNIKTKSKKEMVYGPIKEIIAKPIESSIARIADEPIDANKANAVDKANDIDNTVEEEKPVKKSRKKRTPKKKYEDEVNELVKENKDLKPKSDAKLDIHMSMYEIERKNGKVTIETKGAKEMLKSNVKALNTKSMLEEKFDETNRKLADYRVELEIISRMIINAKDIQKQKYMQMQKSIQQNINETADRLSAIDTLIKEK